MFKQIAEGTKVEIVGEKGIFTVLRQIGGSNNPLKNSYELVDEHGQGFWAMVKDMKPTVDTTFDKIDWQERYDITCPHCGDEMQCSPSIFHRMGCFDWGGGTCPKCNHMFEIHFNPFANRMMTKELFPMNMPKD